MNTTAAAGASTPDSWMRTGDIGHTEDKNWYIFDRAKEFIKACGRQISSAEIDAALIEHLITMDADIIGIPQLMDVEEA